jgi:hypothetical protein
MFSKTHWLKQLSLERWCRLERENTDVSDADVVMDMIL